ncbi:uncharacterized protein [Atheta coriaria]|uniref:uncharacterized protein isoform X2 n=1 Tax=Dalotia coriaria TaxID=877792 RepID=UPI0031F3C529
MGSLQNMLNVYFHMKNHYRKLKNVQSRVNTNNTPKSAGRSKKPRPKINESSSATQGKNRPPTRRNPAEIVDKSVHELDLVNQSPNNKYQTTSLSSQTVTENSCSSVDHHEYLQFSLHITEEIIRNDMFKNEEMISVLKRHYEANKSRLDQERLLKTIAELCSELNLPMDTLLQFDQNGTCSGAHVVGNTRGSTPITVPYSFGPHNKFASSPSENRLIIQEKFDNSVAVGNSSELAVESLGLLPVISEDRISQQQPDFLTNSKEDIMLQISNEKAKDNLKETNQDNDRYVIEVLRSPTRLEDLSKVFEFGEETLTAPGEESIVNLNLMEIKLNEIKEFHVLHDATATFVHESDKESDASITHHESHVSTLDSNTSKDFKSPTNKNKVKNNLVIAHYSTSVEPELVQTKEFSVQTQLDNSQDENIDVCSPNLALTAGGTFVSDASTQKHIFPTSDTKHENEPSNHLVNVENTSDPVVASPNRCLRCNCRKVESDNEVKMSENNGTSMISTGAQYVLLDCPVLIPCEHTKSMEFLNAIGNRAGNYEKSIHTMNIRIPPTNILQNSVSNVISGAVDSYYNVNKNNLHHGDYDLTPQKDMFQSKVQTHMAPTPSQNPVPFGCCSCMSNMATNQSLIDKYDRFDSVGRMERLDRLDRYKKVNDNLSYFYPTIATQVSSMDLLSNGINLYPNLQKPQNKVKQHREPRYSKPRQHNQHQQYDPPKSVERRDKFDNHPHNFINSCDSIPEFDLLTSRTPGTANGSTSNYNTLPKTASVISNKDNFNHSKVNLDNYRIESKHSVGSKRTYGEGLSTCKSPGESGRISPGKSPGGLISEDEVSADRTTDRSLGLYNSTDSMEKRIMSLRHDIEKFSKDDLSITKRSEPESAKRGDMLDILRKNSLNGGILPSELALPRQKKMSILRKRSK